MKWQKVVIVLSHCIKQLCVSNDSHCAESLRNSKCKQLCVSNNNYYDSECHFSVGGLIYLINKHNELALLLIHNMNAININSLTVGLIDTVQLYKCHRIAPILCRCK